MSCIRGLTVFASLERFRLRLQRASVASLKSRVDNQAIHACCTGPTSRSGRYQHVRKVELQSHPLTLLFHALCSLAGPILSQVHDKELHDLKLRMHKLYKLKRANDPALV